MIKENTTIQQVGIVYIHGAGLHDEIWTEVIDKVDYPALQVSFPAGSRNQLLFEDYIVHIQQQIETWKVDKFFIVAHSIGGLLGLKLADIFNNRMIGFIAVGAAIPKKGGTFLSVLPLIKRLLMGLILRLFGTKPPESAIRQGLCNDLTNDQATEIVDSFVPESLHLYIDQLDVSSPDVAKMYVKLIKDQEFPLSIQEQMITNLVPQKVIELDTGHLPMLSNPQQLSLVVDNFIVDNY